MFLASQRSPPTSVRDIPLSSLEQGDEIVPTKWGVIRNNFNYKKMEARKKRGSSLKPLAKARAPIMSKNSCCHCAHAPLPRNSSRTKGMIYQESTPGYWLLLVLFPQFLCRGQSSGLASCQQPGPCGSYTSRSLVHLSGLSTNGMLGEGNPHQACPDPDEA